MNFYRESVSGIGVGSIILVKASIIELNSLPYLLIFVSSLANIFKSHNIIIKEVTQIEMSTDRQHSHAYHIVICLSLIPLEDELILPIVREAEKVL